MDPSRQSYWEKKLRPIRLGAEPVEFQLARKQKGTVALTVLTGFIGLILLVIFAAFGRGDIGVKLAGFFFGVIALWSWFDFAWVRMWVLAYIRERGELVSKDAPPG